MLSKVPPFAPAHGSALVTKSDSVELEDIRGLFIEVGGTIKLTFADGSEDTWTVPDSFYLDGYITKVWSTGTSVTGVHALK